MAKETLEDIQYIESMKDYSNICTKKGPIITKYAISFIEFMLPAASFITVHRSYIVALG
jgi:DNA-binding LytR/AlgR family response regulator